MTVRDLYNHAADGAWRDLVNDGVLEDARRTRQPVYVQIRLESAALDGKDNE